MALTFTAQVLPYKIAVWLTRPNRADAHRGATQPGQGASIRTPEGYRRRRRAPAARNMYPSNPDPLPNRTRLSSSGVADGCGPPEGGGQSTPQSLPGKNVNERMT